MAFYDNPELGASRRVLGNSQFAYNDNPRVIPRLRSEQESTVHTDYSDDFVMPRDQIGVSSNSQHKSTATNRYISIFQQCWLLLFFRLPALYHSRMLQIGVNSGIGTVDLHLMSSTFSALWRHGIPSHPLDSPKDVVAISPHLTQFKASWEVLVDDLLQEWKMFNIISALVQTSVPVLLSLDAQVGSDPITKTGVLLSFICAGISLLCGSFCVLQFGSMRKMPKAAEWIREAHKSNQLVWWNCWIMLAMPATWLAWSVFLLFASIMSYTWPQRMMRSHASSVGIIKFSSQTL
ncbi:hypothetical protein J3R30DRAFT_2182311 [Lentinula aciculospora]|uniref:Transmembrane protein n=1 Tax=Lentinula aciculospora TaxID=153920 RepID=A0A9W9AI58_9AGAR|nr:hypothetical protein J3R30DRAFT_2182311 [Lentinula aciculospora]